MSKRIQCKLKYQEDERAAAHVFQDFIKTFQSNAHPNKVFIKSATLNAKSESEANLERGRIYKPFPIISQSSSATKTALECAKLIRDDMCLKPSKGNEKPKSNLDSLKEELKQRHSERILRKNVSSLSEFAKSTGVSSDLSLEDNCTNQMILDENDLPNRTTNLFINNLQPTLTENELMVLFGEYGPLASVKIMWPRSNITTNNGDDDDRKNNVNCGFVAFMSRRDSERALENMTIHTDMRISWGRPVDIPSFPVYIPPRYQKVLMPPAKTGFPFNAQPIKCTKYFVGKHSDIQRLLYNSRIMVTMPFEKKHIVTIHRMVEFVVREGPLFEAMIMNREMKNPHFEFLFDNKSATHAYYRWKLFSVAHGESTANWSKNDFRMFKGGAIWRPPTVPNFSEGMPAYLCNGDGFENTSDLSLAQEARLIQFIQNIRMTQPSIREVTMYCLNHSSASRPIVDIVCTSLLNTATNPTYKIARLYLLNDILHNIRHGKNRYFFLTAFETYLDAIFQSFLAVYWNLKFNYDRIQFKTRVQRVLRAWACWTLYATDRIRKWEQQFDDKTIFVEDCGQDILEYPPMTDVKLRKVAKSNEREWNHDNVHIDCIENQIVVPKRDNKSQQSNFITSKWEVVDPVEIEANAMSANRLYALENNRLEGEINNKHRKTHPKNTNAKNSNEISKTLPFSSELLRSKLRQIEMQVLQFQDDLESGKVKPKRCRKPDEEIKHYRLKLTRKLSLEPKDISYSRC